MQLDIETLLNYWHIFLPATVLAGIVVWILFKNGYLESMEIFGFKLKFKPDQKEKNASVPVRPRVLSATFTKAAQDDLAFLKMTEDKILHLIHKEFIHHASYFLIDLSHYPLPVQENYVVILDKAGMALNIWAVKSFKLHEEELASLNDLLSQYRRLLRYKYRFNRDHPLRPEAVREIAKSHTSTIHALLRHYIFYKEPSFENSRLIDDYLGNAALMQDSRNLSEVAEYKRRAEASLPRNKAFAYNLITAARSLKETERLKADAENEFISEEDAQRETVLALETSLQYIHQTINLLFVN